MMHARLPVASYLPSLLIAIFYAVISVSLVADTHFWILLLCLCACVVRLFLYLGWYNHAPGKRTVNLLALLASVTLITTSENMDVLHIMVNLLLLACSLKLILLHRRRDFYQLVISGVFIVACGFIFYQSLAWSLFYISVFALLIMVLISAHTPAMKLSQQCKRALILVLQALPIAVLLFVFLPKVPPFWKMPEGHSGETGLSEYMTPGDIAGLTKSEKLAFTASFTGVVPAPQQRYWRAIVLEDFDGNSWFVSDTRRYASAQLQHMGKQFDPKVRGKPFRYEVISEPTQQRWLYALDTAIPASEAGRRDIQQGWNYQLTANQPLFSRFAYKVESFPDTKRDQGIASLDKQLNLHVPTQTNPQTQLWAKKLRARYSDNHAYADAIMMYFRENGFEYTLAPSAMLYDPVDSFLFNYKAGFCAHFASAMAYALRLAGIPARVVSGYQGGKQINDTTINVYQYDAHAWVEAWLDDSGWQTFDPTTQVAPSRITAGFEEAARFSGELTGEHPFTGLGHLEAFAFFRNLSAQMDFLWGKWFLGFNSEKQNAFFTQLLGELSPWKLSLLGVAIVLTILSALALYFLPNWRRKNYPLHYKLYMAATAQLYRQCHIERQKKSPGELLRTLEIQLSPIALTPFRVITAYFEYCEYGGPPVSAAEAKAASREFSKALKQHSR
ncbi:DUF3488 and transglutaminase-like domain-containing protein [Aestuariibacter sp. A3R04]|uniref:transglutaminase TgpA family protein n=1 Tax=Aestuariibacter sp. A3R04 TaxID=2841571 RepID=UPI001C08EFF8|nr:DUF3488 and transglutaminase-like domain-containing protein [Aestuariibacter sp. A3R04]MBU3022595.1 DUF3488 and transglutaminase-like domain-containing protein [Aestuariibacter sp. A3R04]